MINYFVNAWEENKESLREYFKTHKQYIYAENYETILETVIDKVISGYKDIHFKSDDIQSIDYGDCKGTLLFTFHIDTYQPTDDDTFYTSVYYGSCSGCDTLQRICEYDDGKLPTEEQVNDYMQLALHLIQNIKCFGEVENSTITWRTI